MKACMDCQRINLGRNYKKVKWTRTFFGMPFIYIPILFLPFVLLSGLLVHIHLRLMGAENLRSLSSFLPDWESHRYHYKNQLIRESGPKQAFWIHSRLFWFFNCTMYCPFSVALLEWHTYLVKAVENWWCPFAHSKKENYKTAPIDMSYWHSVGDTHRLHKDDQENPIWNDEAVSDQSPGRPTENSTKTSEN